MNKIPSKKYLRFADLKRDYSLPRTTVYDLIKKEGFPKSIRLSTQTVVFKRDAVDAWFAERETMGVAK